MTKNFKVRPTIVLIALPWDQKHKTCYTGDKNTLHKQSKHIQGKKKKEKRKKKKEAVLKQHGTYTGNKHRP